MQGFSRGGDLAADRRRRRAARLRPSCVAGLSVSVRRSESERADGRCAADDGSRLDRRLMTPPAREIIYAARSTRSASEPKRYDPPAITIRPRAI